MWFIRRMLRISWPARKTNAEFLREAGVKRQIIIKIRDRQSRFLGHVLRRANH